MQNNYIVRTMQTCNKKNSFLATKQKGLFYDKKICFLTFYNNFLLIIYYGLVTLAQKKTSTYSTSIVFFNYLLNTQLPQLYHTAFEYVK